MVTDAPPRQVHGNQIGFHGGSLIERARDGGAERRSTPRGGPHLPITLGEQPDDLLRRAHVTYIGRRDAARALVSEKLELLRLFDPPGMDRGVAICHWGRSGSILLASYLDGHPDTVALPGFTSEGIYRFFRQYEHLSIWEKLLAYPEFSGLIEPHNDDFAVSAGPIDAAHYYAAVLGLFESYGDAEPTWLAERRRFFQFLHVAYAVAAGRRPENPRPLMVYAQHSVSDERANQFIEDFPGGKFLHTVRDPISGIDSYFDYQSRMDARSHGDRLDLATRYLDSAVITMIDLLSWDRIHPGMSSRTRAVRFEDLHLSPEFTMRRTAEWLGISYRPCLLESTWNGVPFVVKSEGKSWCGPNPLNARRRWRNLHGPDRLMVFALLYDDFCAWNYPKPPRLGPRVIRLGIIALLWLLPMKMELVHARRVLRMQALPNLRAGRLGFACAAPFFLLKRRLRMMWLIAAQCRMRLLHKRFSLALL